MSTPYASTAAETQYVDAPSARFAYRRIGPQDGVPLVLLHRFRGTLDWWDPEFLDLLAADHDVILFDNIGIGYTQGEPLTTVEGLLPEPSSSSKRSACPASTSSGGPSVGSWPRESC